MAIFYIYNKFPACSHSVSYFSNFFKLKIRKKGSLFDFNRLPMGKKLFFYNLHKF